MSEDKSDNEKLRDKLHQPLHWASESISPKANNLCLDHIMPEEDSGHRQESNNLWWLNTRRRCHRNATIKRNTLRRKH